MPNDCQKTIPLPTMYELKIQNNNNAQLNQLVVTNIIENFKCCIYPNLGASLQQLIYRNIPIINGISNSKKGLIEYYSFYKSAFLFPFPNRIANGRYLFKGKTYQLTCNEGSFKNAIHGHIFNKSFSVSNKILTRTSAKISLSYSNKGDGIGFPFAYDIEITYLFSKNKVTIDFKITNLGKEPFPFGIGWHPYFNAQNLASSTLSFDAIHQFKVNNFMIPTEKTPLKIESLNQLNDIKLDDCFVLKSPKASFKTSDYELELNYPTKSENYLQIYTPDDRKSIAIEPMTCAPDSFNNKNGLLILKQYENYNWTIELNFTKKIK